jgi:hypothetical protein
MVYPKKAMEQLLPSGNNSLAFLEAVDFFAQLGGFKSLRYSNKGLPSSLKNCQDAAIIPSKQARNNELEEVAGSGAVMIKCEVFLFALNSGSSYRTKGFVVTLKIISYDSCDSVPVRTKLSNLKPEHLGYKSEPFIFLKKFEGKEGGET